MGYVYVITLDDRPVYVGKTIFHYNRRWISHIKAALKDSAYPLHRAILKYGLSRMKCLPQLKCEDEDTLFEYEKFLIKASRTRIEDGGYNLTDGGEGTAGAIYSVESRTKISLALRGPRNPWYGKHLPEETRKKMSDSHKGRRNTEEHNRKISEARKGQDFTRGMLGKTHTEESRKKMSDSVKKSSDKISAASKRRWSKEAELASKIDELERKLGLK